MRGLRLKSKTGEMATSFTLCLQSFCHRKYLFHYSVSFRGWCRENTIHEVIKSSTCTVCWNRVDMSIIRERCLATFPSKMILDYGSRRPFNIYPYSLLYPCIHSCLLTINEVLCLTLKECHLMYLDLIILCMYSCERKQKFSMQVHCSLQVIIIYIWLQAGISNLLIISIRPTQDSQYLHSN